MSARPALELCVGAEPENVSVVRHALTGVGESLGLMDELVEDMRLALSEACSNVVLHAYVEEPRPGDLEVLVHVTDEEVVLVVRDRGKGMVPRPDSPGLGVGLPLIATLSDRLELRSGERGGSEVWMAFARDRGLDRLDDDEDLELA